MVWAALSEQQLYPLSSAPDETLVSSALGKIGEALANHACHALHSADNITVTIILLRHSSSPLPTAVATAQAPRRSSRLMDSASASLPSEDKPSATRSTAKGLPAPRVTNSSGSGQSASGAAEKRKLETGVSEDDLMRFLMDDSNF
jgi:hypothetical protein